MKVLLASFFVVLFSQAASAKTIEGSATYDGPTVNMANHDATLKAYEQGSKFVTMLAKEEVERLCREVEHGTIKPESMICIDDCEAKADPYGPFWSAILTCRAKCKVDCEINKE
jgi:hypothetical protein